MDADYVERFRARSRWETERAEPPANFPKLPDLPLGRYTDPGFFALEQELFRRVWRFAAHESQLPRPGSYLLVDTIGAPFLLVRGDDGRVRAFFNACRHRGAPVVRDACGECRLLVCQYHSWSYDLRGDLVRVPDERDFVGLQRDERSLVSLRCETWQGWIFVTEDHDAVPLGEWLAPLPTVLGELHGEDLILVHHQSYDVRCNWKIMAEGFLEVYHARTIHPETVAKSLDGRGAVMRLYPNGHQSMLTPLQPWIIEGMREAHKSGLPEIPDLPEPFFTSNPAHGVFPNLITPLDRTGFPFLVFWPLDIDRTRLDLWWYAPSWGDGPRPEAWDRRLAMFDLVMDEDLKNLEPMQRQVAFAAHGGAPINYQERRIWHVHAWLDKLIGPERIPEHLRVPDLLAEWVDGADGSPAREPAEAPG